MFIDTKTGCLVQAPNLVLNGKVCPLIFPYPCGRLSPSQLIRNIRRSPPMSEGFEFEVAYDTTFEQIEQLRAKMLAFVKQERREYLPTFDVVVQGVYV